MLRILLVEDNEVNREMLRKRLERRGFAVLAAETGEQGLEIARTERPDAVVMDLGLPGIDGYETTRRLKADPLTAAMPVIVLSAHVTAEAREKSVAAGCDDFETKPVQLDVLVNKLHAAMAKRHGPPAAPSPPVHTPSAPTETMRPPPPRVLPPLPPPPSLLTPPAALHTRPPTRSSPRPPIGPPAKRGSFSDTLMLPGSIELPAPPEEPAPLAPEPDPHAKKRILVVEDNDPNRIMLCRRLQKQGFDTVEARDGREALELAHASRFDLMLCDIMMPDVDGYQVLETLKQDPDMQSLPVIMISAVDEMASVVRCIEMGAEDYLQKPYDPVLLQARINACLDKRRLRDQEMAYLRAVSDLTQAAAMVETGAFDAAILANVAVRDDALGRLARVFEKMAREVQAKVQHLTQEVQRLKVEIDEARKTEQVAEITESSYFQQLQIKASQLRKRFRGDKSASLAGAAAGSPSNIPAQTLPPSNP